MDESEKARRQEMLQFQIKELERARLQPGEDEALEQRQKLLMNGEKLSAALSEAVTALFGDEDSRGSAELLDEALGALGGALRYDEALRGPHDRLRELSFALADAGEELRDYRDRLGDSEAELDEIGARLDLIHRLKRKYGASCAEMLDYLARARSWTTSSLPTRRSGRPKRPWRRRRTRPWSWPGSSTPCAPRRRRSWSGGSAGSWRS